MKGFLGGEVEIFTFGLGFHINPPYSQTGYEVARYGLRFISYHHPSF
jgi:hypothetical protein